MEKTRSVLTSGAMVVAGCGLLAVALLGPPLQQVFSQGHYFTPPIEPPRVFNNPISNPLDVTPMVPNDTNPSIAALGQQIGGPAILGVSSGGKFPGADDLKGNPDYILVQPEPGTQITRESPYLISLSEGTVLASVRKPSNVGMLHTPIAEVAFGSNSDAFVTFTGGVLRVRNVDGMGQTLKIRVTSGPLAGKVYSVAPGYELVVSDHKLDRNDLRPTDGILRRQSQTFDNGFAGVSQYHVQSALSQSGVVSHLQSKEASDVMSRKVIGDMSRMAAVLNHVQGGAGYGK